MWDIIRQQHTFRPTIKTAFRPSDWHESVGQLDGYDASLRIRYSNTVKFIWSGEIKQLKQAFMWIYVGYYMLT